MECCWGAAAAVHPWGAVAGVSAAWDEGVSRHEVPADARRSCQQKNNNQQGLARGRRWGPWGEQGPEDDGAGGGHDNITTNHRRERRS